MNKSGKVFIAIVVLCFIWAGIHGATSDTDVKKTAKIESQQIIKISAEEFLNTYKENEINGDKLYKDKIVEITGYVDTIGISLGKSYVTLDNQKNNSATRAQCYLLDESKDKASTLRKGDQITIVGKVNGKSLNVSIYDCKIK